MGNPVVFSSTGTVLQLINRRTISAIIAPIMASACGGKTELESFETVSPQAGTLGFGASNSQPVGQTNTGGAFPIPSNGGTGGSISSIAMGAFPSRETTSTMRTGTGGSNGGTGGVRTTSFGGSSAGGARTSSSNSSIGGVTTTSWGGSSYGGSSYGGSSYGGSSYGGSSYGGSSYGGSSYGGSNAGTTGTFVTCPTVTPIAGTAVVMDLQSAQTATAENGNFFDAPWPELRRTNAELAHFPNPATAKGCSTVVNDPLLNSLLSGIDPLKYRAYTNQLIANFLQQGGNSSAIYFRFDGPINALSLPTAERSLDATTSPVLLVRVDELEPHRGLLVPILSRVFLHSRYLKPNTLSILPHPGFPLEPNALYAAVIRRNLGDVSGKPLGSPTTMEKLKQVSSCSENKTYESALNVLATKLNILRDDIAALSVFRTGSPTTELESIVSHLASRSPTTLAAFQVESSFVDSSAGYISVNGTFNTLIHQAGEPPYLPKIQVALANGSPTLNITFDPNSTDGECLNAPPATVPGGTNPLAPRTERIAFRLALPYVAEKTVSFTKLPVVVYGVGTGGSVDSPFNANVASTLAQIGIATFVATPPMHGNRAHSENIDPQLTNTLKMYDLLTGSTTVNQLTLLPESFPSIQFRDMGREWPQKSRKLQRQPDSRSFSAASAHS